MDGRRGIDYTEGPTMEGANVKVRLTERGGAVVFILFWGVILPLILFGFPR